MTMLKVISLENLIIQAHLTKPFGPHLVDVVAPPRITTTQHACTTPLVTLTRLDTCHAPDADMAGEREAERPITLLDGRAKAVTGRD